MFLLACNTVYNMREVHNNYKGKNFSQNAWLSKCMVDVEGPRFVCQDYALNSMLLFNEYIHGICEFSVNKLLVHIMHIDLLVVQEWTVTNLI